MMAEYQDPGETTHDPLEMDAVWDLGELIDEACPDGKVSMAQFEVIAKAEDVPVSHVLAAAAFDPDYEWQVTKDRQITVCLGACQGWGAREITERLLSIQKEREASGKASFDVLSVGCLDRCASPVAVDVIGPEGGTQHSLIRPGAEDSIVEALCD
jgi:hypothetical protein